MIASILFTGLVLSLWGQIRDESKWKVVVAYAVLILGSLGDKYFIWDKLWALFLP